MRLDKVPRIVDLPRGRHQFVLADGTPFFLRAAELQNSSFSSSQYMDKIWPILTAQHINLAFGPATWEDIEPEEGQFFWEELDRLVEGARKHEIKLVILWFGAWKNGMSNYAPAWVKRDPKRFPRSRVQPTPGSPSRMVEVLSPFSKSTLDADTKAFEALMAHLKCVDGDQGTVIMVQVENEVGLLGDSRDRSPIANTVFDSPVPEEVIAKLSLAAASGNLKELMKENIPCLGDARLLLQSKGKSWSDVFGVSMYTDELFMAYHYAKYINHVASAGQRIYNLPMFTNGWLRTSNSAPSSTAGGGAHPGEYPSGGPADSVIDIYHLFAPSLRFVSPDIYLVDYAEIFKAYKHNDQPLFVPEHRRDEYGALRIWQAIGDYDALAMGPFGIDTLDPLTSPWTKHYGLLSKIEGFILEAWQKGSLVTGFYFDRFDVGQPDPSVPKEVNMGDWRLKIQRAATFGGGHPEPGYGMIIQRADDSFLLIGEGYMVNFRSLKTEAVFTGILEFDEMDTVKGKPKEMRKIRRLNGDEIKSGRAAVMPTLGAGPAYGDFPIAITIPGETGMALCTVYSLSDCL
ncbi:hypothetical protein I302_106435 [Kwoniella bestiolae CBS 10118]|uniref:Beta-galactosidase n=1 Tax=Kwoniella bestiolae CBS 10118 TaxID=1296100 RepID=A0A1B9G1F4_9TREE|nr:hypothetical protein I302_06308 [Kwoniella bestiolae CBS 10118]OCF24847.1 hypothetical protein I302_06308 [Kwoniella bestiolae CBS 10118]